MIEGNNFKKLERYQAIVFFTQYHQFMTGDICKTLQTNQLKEVIDWYLEMKPIANKIQVIRVN